jgi:SSS family solute:Na+ symporter
MNNRLTAADYLIFVLYLVLVGSYGYWVYHKRKSKEHDSKGFFLAEGSLTWWAIGASLIASNISAEQFIGMSGNGFFVGVAVSAYEWIAAISLIIIAIWFIPIYLKNKIYTMPQFLKTRYNETVAMIMAILWLFIYVFVNLTSILYLGAVAISGLLPEGTQIDYLHIVMLALAVFSIFITLGGMKVIGYTDVIQVTVLIAGGLATSYMALDKVSGGHGATQGFTMLMQTAPEHFHMIFKKPGTGSSQEEISKYLLLPGILMYAAGQWIVNLNYWGCNQYITQRALGADLTTARTGLLFAALLKLIMPLIVMLPGIAAYVLMKQGHLASMENQNMDHAYSAVLGFLPAGLKGLSIAALTAAIVASLAGKINSISTIYTFDIYKKYINKNASEQQTVRMGRAVALVSLIIAIMFTWKDVLGISSAGGFTYIQKYTGFISPGVFAMFLLGMFWKRTTGTAAVVGVITGVTLCFFFNELAPAWFGNNTWFYTAYPNGHGGYEIPFLIAMGLSFFFTVLIMVIVSLTGPAINHKAFIFEPGMFKLKPQTTALAVIIILLLTALYVKFW